MKSIEQLRKEGEIKEREAERARKQRTFAEEAQISREQVEAERKARIEAAKEKSRQHFVDSGAQDLIFDFDHLNHSIDDRIITTSDIELSRYEKPLKSRDKKIRRYMASVFPYTPNEQSYFMAVSWETDIFGRFKGRSGFIVETTPDGRIRFVGERTYSIDKSQWENNTSGLEQALNLSAQQPMKLVRREFSEKVPETVSNSGYGP